MVCKATPATGSAGVGGGAGAQEQRGGESPRAHCSPDPCLAETGRPELWLLWGMFGSGLGGITVVVEVTFYFTIGWWLGQLYVVLE